jgi:hypothetical protein
MARCGSAPKCWYDGGSCCIKVDGSCLMKQGSVLSPAPFLLVLDLLLRELQKLG